MPDALRNRLWTVVRARIGRWTEKDLMGQPRPTQKLYELWDRFYKQPVDTLPVDAYRVIEKLRDLFFNSEWNEIYDLLEFIAAMDAGSRSMTSAFSARVNEVLEQELAAWRFVGQHLQRITDQAEMEAVVAATENSIEGVRLHIRSALACLSQRPTPDTRNAIKEAVSAVESAAKSVTGRDSAVFTALTQRLQADGAHPQFVQAWKNLYNYTSDASGVRHGAKTGDEIPSVDEAKLFVLTASAFTNYLVAHYSVALANGEP